MSHILDEKPTVSRQLIAALPAVARAKPTLAGQIRAALAAADPSIYPESTRFLVKKDILHALEQI